MINNKKVVLLELQENHLKRIIFCVGITPLHQECGQKHGKPGQARLAKVLAGLARKAWP